MYNPTGESFTAIEIVDSYTPGGGGNSGSTYDWAFNLIAEPRLTDFATVAWAPGSTTGARNDNPVWVTPNFNTTVYVKYDGDLVSGGSVSPCGLHYDVSYTLNALTHKRLLDPTDNDQSGMAIFTCNGAKLAAVYGEDPSTAVTGNPSWDVGSTIQPFCKEKLIFANDDYARTPVNQPVTIPILLNDYGFLAVVDPTSVTNTGLLQPKHGSIIINTNGTILYTPANGYVGNDTLEYSVCSTPAPIVCDIATVYIQISVCPTPLNQNMVTGQVYNDRNKDGINNDGGDGIQGAKVYLYADVNCNHIIDPNELKDSVVVDASGNYQFITYPEKFVADDFDGAGGTKTCANGSDGSAAWASNWVDAGDVSVGFCNNTQTAANTNADIFKDGSFSYALRLKNANISATRTVNLTGASYAFLTFSYRRKSATLTAGHNIIVQASSNGTTFGTVFTIAGDGNTDANYVTIYNQDITAYASATTYIRFLTNSVVGAADTVYIDDIRIQYLSYPQCYITGLATSSVPINYYTTSPTQKTFTAVGTASCFAPHDFGIGTALTTLPIVSIPLTGIGKQNDNLLYWSTESETNTNHFEIQNSVDGSNFINTGSVVAKGNTTSKSYYSFTHHDPLKVVNYYRIKQVDGNGKINYSNTISIKPAGEQTKMTVIPNPFNASVLVAVNLKSGGNATLTITDMLGRPVKTMICPVTQGFNSILVNGLEPLPSGTYILQIKNEDQVVFSKIIKVK